MRRYTIAKTLVLSLSVLSVVARSLPERQLEINVRSPGDVSDPTQRLEELGPVKRDTTLEKRDGIVLTRNSDISYECRSSIELAPIWSDCEALCIRLGTGTLSVQSLSTHIENQGTCIMVLVNPTPTTISMDLVDLTIVAERLNTRCISAYGSQGTYYGSAGFQGIQDFAPPSILLFRNSPIER